MEKIAPFYKDPLSHHHEDEPHSHQVSPWLVSAVLVLATLVLAALNSEALAGYLEGLEPNVLTEAALPLAYGWNDMMQALGLTEIGRAIRDFITTVRDYRFAPPAL